jgi:3-deoxy-manno-octulosonate cytidylyltransferase (CMP-KDO synthetase)
MGDKNQTKITAIIPARYASTRLPAKLLLDLAGKPVIQHVYERASSAKLVDQIIVATDDKRIEDLVKSFNGNVVITSDKHETGTDRIAEVAKKLDSEIIVNIQGDEPFISPNTIDKAVEPLLLDQSLMMGTTCELIDNYEDIFNPNVVKVVKNTVGDALYFSRSPIPFPRFAALGKESFEPQEMLLKIKNESSLLGNYFKHTGIYVYRREFLLKFTTWPRSEAEKVESLEQLRVLENAYRIKVVEVKDKSIGIDTLADLEKARELLKISKI